MYLSQELNKEIARLTKELQQTAFEKIKAAEYGLTVLEEKHLVEEKFDDLSSKHANIKSENSLLKQQIEALKCKRSVVQNEGETETRESLLAAKIADLQVELKSVRRAERTTRENIDLRNVDLTKQQSEIEELKEKVKQLYHENKELKMRECSFNEEYNVLEEENTALQKNICKLKHTLVEFEGLKVENASYLDEIDSLQFQLQMNTCARDQYEKQLHEALDTLREQREQIVHQNNHIHQLKQESISWQIDEIKYTGDHPIVKQIKEEYTTPAAGLVDDLMKELQFGEIRQLEVQLRQVQDEKEALKHIINQGGDDYTCNNHLAEVEDLNSKVKELEKGEAVSRENIEQLTDNNEQLTNRFKELELQHKTVVESKKDEVKALTDQLLEFKSKLRGKEERVKSLSKEMTELKEARGVGEANSKSAYEELKFVFKDILLIISMLQPNKPSTQPAMARQLNKFAGQVKQQTRAVLIAVEKIIKSNAKLDPNNSSQQIVENSFLKEQLLKAQSVVATKREQISTLRTVLKANKSTYEVALANLKSRYESDKALQTDACAQLKRQIKSLKNDCATFSAMQSQFATRCDNYMKQIEHKEKQVLACEEEKHTLNLLLKQAIHQKIHATQRLEEYDLARERLKQFTKTKKPITRV